MTPTLHRYTYRRSARKVTASVQRHAVRVIDDPEARIVVALVSRADVPAFLRSRVRMLSGKTTSNCFYLRCQSSKVFRAGGQRICEPFRVKLFNDISWWLCLCFA